MIDSKQVLEMVEYWNSQAGSDQRDVCISYWVKQARKLGKYHYDFNGDRVVNSSKDKRNAFKAIALVFGVPAKKSGEDVFTQMMRLTYMGL